MNLKNNGVYWMDEPDWQRVPHDIKTIDIRLAFERGVENIPSLVIEDTISEAVFRAQKDRVVISGNKNGRIVIPDLFLLVVDTSKRERGEANHNARFLFEIDMGNHSNPRFEKEKLTAYAAYLGSKAYIERFHSENGKWLIITTGKKRMRNLLRLVEKMKDKYARQFFFSTHHQVLRGNPQTDAIWWQPKKSSPISLYKQPSVERKRVVFQSAS